MKVLFVCHYNVGRSQMAKALYNSLSHSHDADSAGTNVKEPGQTLLERKQSSSSSLFFVIDVMDEIGIDISSAVRTQLTEEMLKHYDKVISMAEKETSPEWLLAAPNYIYWDVKDPRGQSFEITASARDEIKSRVTRLYEDK
jgi:arsenate reductase